MTTTATATDPARQRTALVTGASSGIGRATARALARDGVHVIVQGRDAERGEAVVEQIRAEGGDADFVRADLYDAGSAQALAREALAAAGGRIDILVNNAGGAAFQPTPEVTEADFDGQFGVNVKVPFFLTAALVPAMAERGDGAIVNVSSTAAIIGAAGMAAYGASKAALAQLTRMWVAEYGPKGVRVNTVTPGPTFTNLGPDELTRQLAEATPAGVGSQPEDVAAAIAFLASPAARIHGTNIHVDGGRTSV